MRELKGRPSVPKKNVKDSETAAADPATAVSNLFVPSFVKADVDGNRFYRVRIGPFSYAEEAEVTLAKVKNFGIYNAKVVQD